jgi:hypothetical protein
MFYAKETNDFYLTHAKTQTNWIDLYKISISPCGNLIVISYRKQFLILQAKWETNNQIKYSISSKIFINSVETLYVYFFKIQKMLLKYLFYCL